MNGQKYLRGQVWWVGTQKEYDGHIMSTNRPHIIISNNKVNQTSSVLLTVPCTTAEEREGFNTHVKCEFNGKNNLVLCEQIKPINVSDIANYMLTLDEETMSKIDCALSNAIGLPSNKKETETEKFNVLESVLTLEPRPIFPNYEPTFVNIEEDEMFMPKPITEIKAKKSHKHWDNSEKEIFIAVVDEEGVESASKAYGLSEGTIKNYYSKFKRELEG